MLFELSIAKKYLIPKKKQLTLSLIALMSIGVISLVVWLILIFLSVTDGIEKNWLSKLTSLNAPIQITPTQAYYHSYYYLIDGISYKSGYEKKNIKEKITASFTDPYSIGEDVEIPAYFPEKDLDEAGRLKDLIKMAFESIENIKLKNSKPIAEDYEIGGALLKLHMIHFQNDGAASRKKPTQSYLTQASYVQSFSEKNPFLPDLIEIPRPKDLNHLIYLTQMQSQEKISDTRPAMEAIPSKRFQKKVGAILENITLKKMKNVQGSASFLLHLLPENTPFRAFAYQPQKKISYLLFNDKKKHTAPFLKSGFVRRKKNHWIFTSDQNESFKLNLSTPLFSEEPLSMNAHLQAPAFSKITSLRDIKLLVSFKFQNHLLEGIIPWKDLEIEEAKPHVSFEKPPQRIPPWPYRIKDKVLLPQDHEEGSPILLPKNFQSNGVKIGDKGYFSYQAPTTSTLQEQRLTVKVAGFYDPGIIAIGGRMLLASHEVVQSLNHASESLVFDKNMQNGIQVWFPHIDQSREVEEKIKKAFQDRGLLSYFNITPYTQYEFAKDLLKQFQSDKYLFTLIGIIILIVACSNIISLLVILVNDKKKEIAILSAMGASKKSIALIFTFCGGFMGLISTCIGTLAALVTLHHIDALVQLLSFLQGQEAFNTLFYGSSLPNDLSKRALVFILIATPLISLVAGLVPALKATKIHPSKILRSE